MSRAPDLRQRLAELAPALRPIAQNVLTESSRIDLVAIDADGAAVAVFDGQGDDLATFTRALGSSAWLEQHLPDWCQIAPDLGLDAAAPVRALLVACSFAPETRAAAARVRDSQITLLTADAAAGSVSRTLPEPTRAAEPERPLAGRTRRAANARPRSPFRSGLSNADLGLADTRS
jgi:hypothetical protein